MKTKLLLIIPLLFVTIAAMAESALIIQPLQGNEQAAAIASIGHVLLKQDSIFVFSHAGNLLWEGAVKDVRYIRYGDASIPTAIDDVNNTTCRIYPNPSQDMLMIDNADTDKAYIFDLNGHLLCTVAISGEHASVNISSLPQGEYLLLLNTQAVKFIKR